METVKHKIGVGGVITPYHKKLVNQVRDSGRISYRPFLQRFENEFAKTCQRKFAISANSGTSALQVAERALRIAGFADWQKYIAIDERYHRPNEVHHLVGDITKAKTQLGWKPKTKFKDLVRIMLEADCNKCGINLNLIS